MMMNQLAQFIEPTAPDVTPIHALHRGGDHWVSFARKSLRQGGKWEPLFNCPAAHLPELFPQFIAPHVGEDSYHSVNGMWMDGARRKWASKTEPRFPPAQRNANKNLQCFTSCFVDIDCYTKELTPGFVLGAVHDAVQAGKLPAPSMFVDSGRGVWLYWMLREDDSEKPVRAWPEKRSTWNRIQRQLIRGFAELGADANCTDAARVTRVPGSLNSKSNTRVRYWLPLNESGKPFRYRLDELAVMIGVRPAEYSEGVKRVVDPRFRERGVSGHRAAHRNRFAALVQLAAVRGRIKQGCRECFVRELALTGFRLRDVMPEWEKTVWDVARFQCDPPMEDKQTEFIIDRAKKTDGGYKMKSRFKLGDQLKVTEAEAEVCGIPPAGADRTKDDCELRTRRERMTVRREKLRAFIENPSRHNYPTVPPLGVLADYIESEMGERPSENTIRADLARLGVKNPRAHKAHQLPDKPLWTMEGAGVVGQGREESGAS